MDCNNGGLWFLLQFVAGTRCKKRMEKYFHNNKNKAKSIKTAPGPLTSKCSFLGGHKTLRSMKEQSVGGMLQMSGMMTYFALRPLDVQELIDDTGEMGASLGTTPPLVPPEP